MGRFKKYLSIILIAFLMLYNTMLSSLVLAEEAIPNPTPTPASNAADATAETQADNNTQTSNDIDTTSNTGDNVINPTPASSAAGAESDSADENAAEATPAPTPLPDAAEAIPTPTPKQTEESSSTPSAELKIESDAPSSDPSNTNINNTAEVSSDISSESNSGDNSISATESEQINSAEDSSYQVPGNEGTIDTGNAASVTNVENSLNYTSVNSEIINQTINLFVDENQSLNLSDPFTIATSVILEHPEDSVINVSVTNVNNYAYLSNDIISYANTGGNSINSSNTATASAAINTGNAYSAVSLLNKVNFTIINSKLHILSINIFGNLNGDIVLPDLPASSSVNCDTCGISLSASNNAVLENNINSIAVTGKNSISGLSGSITTGDAASVVNLLNVLNTTFFGTAAQGLYINVLGSWIGNFIGWNALGPVAGGGNIIFNQTGPALLDGSSCQSCNGDTNIQNDARVINNISSNANTGSNSIEGGNGTITTGNAFSAVSLINLINTNFINSFGFFGFLNIFGNWVGDIGGHAEFEALESSHEEETRSEETVENSNSNSEGSSVRENGGLLSVTQTNNVGGYVLPGDTVTFFVKVKNTGSGKVYETKLNLYLIKDGKIAGGTTFDLGGIDAGKGKTLTTGFVLSEEAPGGQYVARADAEGVIGPTNNAVFASADSSFNVVVKNLVNAAAIGSANTPKPTKELILGASLNFSEKLSLAMAAEKILFISLLTLVIFTYVSIRLIRKKEFVFEIILSNNFKGKLAAFRMFLL